MISTENKLYDRLVSYSKEDYYPMHMPGHKRNINLATMVNPYSIDITEIDGFDNLHQAEGIVRQLSLRMSRLYHSKKAYPLINGSTAGILAGISATTKQGDKVLIGRNSHKSVYHAVALRSLRPSYIYPERVKEIPICGGILPEKVEDLLIKHQDIRLVVITSPTYEGVVSDIRRIADIVHRHGALLMVDEAHGAHFGFHDGFPKSAIILGADLVVQSIHKTLPALTQTAVLHCNRSELNHRIEQYLGIYQSSSPSYILMAAMDRCISLLEEQANSLFEVFNHNLQEFYQSIDKLKNLKIIKTRKCDEFGICDMDISKIMISTRGTNITGHQLHDMLRDKHHIEMEMEAKDYVLGMTSICDTKEGFSRLKKALLSIDQEVALISKCQRTDDLSEIRTKQSIIPSKAMEQKMELSCLKDSSGRIAAEIVCLFPPGSPLLVPGEVIDKEFLEFINSAKQEGLRITGLHSDNADMIAVICEGEKTINC